MTNTVPLFGPFHLFWKIDRYFCAMFNPRVVWEWVGSGGMEVSVGFTLLNHAMLNKGPKEGMDDLVGNHT